MTTEICTACHGIGGTQSQSRPGRIIAQCGSCGGTGEIEHEFHQVVNCKGS